MAKNTASKLSLVTMLLVCLVPLMLAFIMYFYQWAVPEGRTNNGTLLMPPEQLSSVLLTPIKVPDVAPDTAWKIIYVPTKACAEACVKDMHMTRQLHLALGKEAGRVIRILLVDEPHAEAVNGLDDYPNLTLAAVSDRRIFSKGEGVYIVDPLGNIMMFYTFAQIGKPILKDLKKLLRNSNIG